MDIHKPKPWHGVREFLKEYVIIVVGVLTALALEQSVEWLHWREKALAGEAALRRDLGLVADFATERVAISRCQDERLALVRNAVLASPGRWDAALPAETAGLRHSSVYQMPFRVWSSHIWENLGADGTLAHLDPERARNFALLYSRIKSASDNNGAEFAMVSELDVLSSKGVELTPDGKLRLLAAVNRLRLLNAATSNVSKQILRQIQDAGYLPPLAQTTKRLAATTHDLTCRYAQEALKDRVAASFYTLRR